jgi:predicted ATPase
VREELKGEGRPIVEWRCSPYHQNSGLYPAIDYFERQLRLRGEDAPGERIEKVVAALQPLGLNEPEVVSLLAALLSIPPDERHSLPALTPQRLKERTLEVLLDWMHAYADRQPTLFIVEDLHWIDATTLEFLGQLIAQAEADKLLIVLTSRPEFTPSWAGRARLTQVALNRLTRGQIAEMVRRKTEMTAVPQGLVDQIADRTDGVPLFVEEFTKMMLEAGAFREASNDGGSSSSLPVQAIPATLQDLLLARLDRMGSVRDVVQVASAIGREFPYAMLRAVCPLEEADLRRELTKLIQAEILFAKGRPPQSSYLFKHALIQDAAYQSLLKPRRREFHRLIAQALVQQFPEKAEREPALLGRHYTEAGLPGDAIIYWEKAPARLGEVGRCRRPGARRRRLGFAAGIERVAGSRFAGVSPAIAPWRSGNGGGRLWLTAAAVHPRTGARSVRQAGGEGTVIPGLMGHVGVEFHPRRTGIRRRLGS